jgi:ankyrin repeat protein
LHYAAQESVEVLRLLITLGGGDVNKSDMEGDTPLFYAVRNNNMEAVRCLVEAKADVSHENDGEIDTNFRVYFTPLHVAAKEGYVDVVRFLAEHGDVNNFNNDGKTVLHIAARNGHVDVVRCLVTK